jgi:hypothetical protein
VSRLATRQKSGTPETPYLRGKTAVNGPGIMPNLKNIFCEAEKYLAVERVVFTSP